MITFLHARQRVDDVGKAGPAMRDADVLCPAATALLTTSGARHSYAGRYVCAMKPLGKVWVLTSVSGLGAGRSLKIGTPLPSRIG